MAGSGSVSLPARRWQALAGQDGVDAVLGGDAAAHQPPGAWRRRPELPGLAAQGAAVAEPRVTVGAEQEPEAVGVRHASIVSGVEQAVKENPDPLWPCAPGPSGRRHPARFGGKKVDGGPCRG